MNTTVATIAGRALAAAIICGGLAAIAVALGADPGPIVDAVNRLAN